MSWRTRRLPAGDADIEAEVRRIEQMNLPELRAAWEGHLGEPAPRLSKEILRRLLAYKVQERAYGGLSAATKRKLRQLYAAFSRDPGYTPSPILDLKPGTILVREWRGIRHQVRVLNDGFEYSGKAFASLSEVARRITGSRWSGPLFFGLKRHGGA